jgi:hypothetical protein
MAWHGTAPHGTTPHRIALHCIALHCTARHGTAPHGTALQAFIRSQLASTNKKRCKMLVFMSSCGNVAVVGNVLILQQRKKQKKKGDHITNKRSLNKSKPPKVEWANIIAHSGKQLSLRTLIFPCLD